MSDSGTCDTAMSDDTDRLAKITRKKKTVRMKQNSRAVRKSLVKSSKNVLTRGLKRNDSATRSKATVRNRDKAKTALDDYEDNDQTEDEEEAVLAAVGLAPKRLKGGRYVLQLNLMQP